MFMSLQGRTTFESKKIEDSKIHKKSENKRNEDTLDLEWGKTKW